MVSLVYRKGDIMPAKAIYRVRLVVDKFTPAFEGQHRWSWGKETLRTVSICESTELRDALKDHSTIVDALLSNRQHPPSW